MRITLLFWLAALLMSLVFIIEAEETKLIQNKPSKVNEIVTFTIEMELGDGQVPFIAWDFGDGSGLGMYKKSLTASHRFTEPGVYQVFARIQGELIPLTVTQTVYTPVTNPEPTHSSTISIDTTHKLVWAVNADNNSVTCIDAENDQFIREVTVGKHPRTVAIKSNGDAWVANEDDATITVIDYTGEVTDVIDLPYASRPFGVCFDPQSDYAYVTLQGTGQLVKLDASSKEILNTLDIGRTPRGIAIPSDGQKVFVTQFISPETQGVVREVNVATMTLAKEIELAFDETPDFEDRGRGVPNYISSITITPDGSQAWVPSKKDNTARGLFRDGQELTFDNTVRTIVSRIDLATGEEMPAYRTDINDADMACAVAFSPYGNIAFVALQGNNKISMIHVPSNARLGLLDSTGLAPQGLVFNPDGTKLYVHNFMSRTVKVFDTEDIILSNNFVPKVITEIKTVENELLNEQVLLGKQIFYNAEDDRMNFAGYISCASCHLDGGSDERVWDFTDRGEGFRNTHSLNGKGGVSMGNVHWTANFDEIQDFENDIRNAFGGSGFMADELFESGTTSDPLGDSKAGLSEELDALAAYVTSLDKVHPSPYRNADGSLTASAKAGKEIFANVGCGNCHAGPDFTDKPQGLFHDVGTIEASSGKRRNQTLTGLGTPTLKGIWETAPYLHDGSAATLYDVLVTKNQEGKHGDLSGLSTTEINQLIDYLLQIDETDDEVVTFLLPYVFQSYTAELSVSPNPAKEHINLTLVADKNFEGKITITSMDGRKVYQEMIDGGVSVNVNVKNFKSGFYIVNYNDGNKEMTSKFVVP